MNNRPKDPKTARNKNVLVIGGSGSGKTRFFVKPNLMQCMSKDYPTSFVITDPKGSLIGEVGQLLIRSGYRVKVLNTINFSKSMKYNPFRYLHSEKDVLKLVNTLICNTKGEGEKSAEDFWVKSERLFYTALIGYIWQEAPEEEMNFTTLLEMINASEAREDDPEFQSPVDLMFERLEERDPDHFAVRQYKKFLLSAGKTRSSILISAGARMAPFDIREVRELMEDDELDISYQLAQADTKTAIFENLCDLYNYLDASIHVQLSFVNRKTDPKQYAKSFEIKAQGDDFDDIRAEYSGILQDQLVRGNNGLTKRKFLTFTIEADNLKMARARLTRIETDLLGYFKTMGAVAHVLDAKERLEVLHGVLHPDAEPFQFEWKWLAPSGLSTKDFIAPSSFRFGNSRMFGLGGNHIKIERSLTTSSVAVFVPFVTQELFMGGDAMYYGVNAKTGNMIMLDRKRARCPNGLKLGTPGSGKSMSCKSEIVSVFLCTPDDVYICDPEAEYYPLVKRLHGQVVKLSPTSKSYVNPLDINLNYSEDENPLALKSDFVLSFCELVMGGKNGLEAIEKTVIDRAVQVIYRPYLADPRPENMPILSDLHQALLDQHIPEADRVAQALDLYVNGSLNVFNHRTNVNIENRIVAFDIKELGKQLKKLGMLIVQDQIWGRVTQNRSQGKATWYFCDEFHLLLREEQTAAFSCEIWKRFRKWGGIPTGATQNVKDLLSSPEIENILENSDFICLLNQASGDRRILAERLNISPQQLRYVDNSEPGEGLLIYENVILPFRNPIPQRSQLYKIMTTRLGEGETV